MPEYDGYTVARLIRALQAVRHAPLIAYTSFSEADARARGSLADFDGFCQKGTSPELLLKLIAGFFPDNASGSSTDPGAPLH